MYALYLSSGLFLCAFVCLWVVFSKKSVPNTNSRSFSLSCTNEHAIYVRACMRSDGHRTCGTLRAQHSSRRRRHQLLVFFSQSRFPPPDSPPAPHSFLSRPVPSPPLFVSCRRLLHSLAPRRERELSGRETYVRGVATVKRVASQSVTLTS